MREKEKMLTLNLCFSKSDMIKCAMSDDTTYPGPFAYGG